MFKFLKNLINGNCPEILNHIDKLDGFKVSDDFSSNDFVFKFNDYGYVYEIELVDSFCKLKIFERSENYSTSIFDDDNDWYEYISGTWDDELINKINSIHNKILRDKQQEEYNKMSDDEKAKTHFNKKFSEK